MTHEQLREALRDAHETMHKVIGMWPSNDTGCDDLSRAMRKCREALAALEREGVGDMPHEMAFAIGTLEGMIPFVRADIGKSIRAEVIPVLEKYRATPPAAERVPLELHHYAAIERAASMFDRETDLIGRSENPYDAMFPEGDAQSLREVLAYLKKPAAEREGAVDPDCVICPGCAHQFQAIPVSVQKRLHADAQDAARYRWLRDQTYDEGLVLIAKDSVIPRFVNYASAIDNYIDAAIDKQRGAGGG